MRWILGSLFGIVFALACGVDSASPTTPVSR